MTFKFILYVEKQAPGWHNIHFWLEIIQTSCRKILTDTTINWSKCHAFSKASASFIENWTVFWTYTNWIKSTLVHDRTLPLTVTAPPLEFLCILDLKIIDWIQSRYNSKRRTKINVLQNKLKKNKNICLSKQIVKDTNASFLYIQ